MKSPITSNEPGQREATADIYDRQFSEDEQSRCHYLDSIWFSLYREVCRQLEPARHHQILEVGCGTGALAHCILENVDIPYRGFDFSSVAVQQAQRRTKRDDCFFVGDARAAKSYEWPYDTIVCLEVLEHIERDLDVVAHWRSSCECICSVPNFSYQTHVRWFQNEQEIVSRYGHLISFRNIRRVSSPLVRGRRWRAYLRQLRWSRNDPRRLMGLLGYRTFENFAGWFLFCGTRK
jgi:2-polyprenyl-3-methyl-5-hydroxy-6-metoxy-1,4-benzoquinol methylase